MITITTIIHRFRLIAPAISLFGYFNKVRSLLMVFILLFVALQGTAQNGGIDEEHVKILTDAPALLAQGSTGNGNAFSWSNGSEYLQFDHTFENSKKITTIITFKVHENTTIYIPADFQARVKLLIEYGDNENSLLQDYKTLKIDYTKGDGDKKYKAMAYCTVPDAQYVRVTVVNASTSTPANDETYFPVVGGVDSKQLVELEEKQLITRFYQLAPNVQYQHFNVPATVPLTVDGITADDHLSIDWDWPANAGNNYTQLEWAWLTTGMEAVYNNASGVFDENLLFANNSTRLDLPYNKLSYDIPMLYDGAGKLYCRIRAVNLGANSRADGAWSAAKICNFDGHQNNLNWQASTSYAEDGKRKTVIQYFDGSLRTRQTVTKDNETQTLVTAETMYDGEGRAALQILPAPNSDPGAGVENVIRYRANLNLFNGRTADNQNPAEIFDLEPVTTAAEITLDKTVPNSTANYYSNLNPDINKGVNKNIPDAEGYPYTLTRFTPDATGRVMAQSGVGPNYKIGSGKETKYYYSIPSQEELDALFGTEVGTFSHYAKNMVKDANGQVSVNYVDMHGRTIATALAGDVPTNVTGLNRGTPQIPGVDYPNQQGNLVNMNLLDVASNIVKDNSVIESVSSLSVSSTTDYQFKYKLTPDALVQPGCPNPDPTTLCYQCLYDLEIAITDESGENEPIVRKYTNLSLSGTLSDDCSTITPAPFRLVSITPVDPAHPHTSSFGADNSVNFSETLPIGSYSVRKTLSISESSLQTYKEMYLAKAECKTEQQYIDEAQTAQELATNCAAGPKDICASCNDAQGAIYVESRFTDFANNYLFNFGVTVTTASPEQLNAVRTAFNANKANCDLVCNKTSQALPTIRQMMLEDMKPYAGQYAMSSVPVVPDPTEQDQQPLPDVTGTMYPLYNIFSASGAGGIHQPFFQHPATEGAGQVQGNYLDAQGNNDHVFVDGMTETDYVQKFQDSWLTSLLPYHPEYPRLLFAEQHLTPSYNWIKNFKEADYAAASLSTNNFINPLTSDPFFTEAPASYASTMTNAIAHYPGNANFGMWQLAYGDINCKTLDASQRQTCYTNQSNAPLPIGNPSFTPAQNAQAWEMFKGLYAAERERLVNDYIAKSVPLSNSSQLVAQHYHLWFPENDQQAADQSGWNSWWPTNPGDAPGTITGPALPETPLDKYTAACGGYIDMWKSRLLQCDALNALANKDGILNEITARMKQVCINGSDDANATGSSTINPVLTGQVQDNSFEDVIKNVFAAYGIITNGVFADNFCNPFVIDWPKPYGKSPKVFEGEQTPIVTDCNCSQFTKMKAEAVAANYDPNNFTSLNLYLQATYNEVLTIGMYNGLLRCPGAQTTCAKCDDLSNVVNSFYTQYPNGGYVSCEIIPTQIQYNARVNDTPTVYKATQSIMLLPGFESPWGNNFVIGIVPLINCDPQANCQQNFTAFFNNYYNNAIPLTWAQIEAQYITNCGASPAICGTAKDYSCATLIKVECKFLKSVNTDAPAGVQPLSVTNPTQQFTDFFNNYYHNSTALSWNEINALYSGAGCDPDLNDHLLGNKPLACGNCSAQLLEAIVLPNPEPVPDFLHCGFTPQHCVTCAAISAYTAEFKAKFGSPVNGAPFFENDQANLTADQLAQNENFARFLNFKTGFQYKWMDYAQKANDAGCSLDNYAGNSSANQQVVCGYAYSITDPTRFDATVSPCEDAHIKAIAIGHELYIKQQQKLLTDMEAAYRAKCLAAKDVEQFSVSYQNKEYHYTLYYYDMAGNLVKTVAPKGVQPIYNAPVNATVLTGNTNTVSVMSGTSFHALVEAARTGDYADQYVPVHQFTTNYRYNSLNQVVAQNTPDAATSHFWYDRLGRLIISQNAKQLTENKYSYTHYDLLGRITEVGQKPNTTAPDQDLLKATNGDAAYTAWLYNGVFDKEQITRTTYDEPCPVINPPPAEAAQLEQKNLRNRVSFSQYFDGDPDSHTANPGDPEYLNHSSASYYTYDIHGNVDILLQDYRGIAAMSGINRYKKITYDYDLISGKVNEVAYQPGAPDAFYHKYSYDAENRLTEVHTSKDNIIWEFDARYSYYKHGPLARTGLGQLQVQGMDYAYTLQGWLKGINSTSLNPLHDIGADGTGPTVAKDVVGFALHYYDDGANALDYKPIGGATVNSFARPATGIGFNTKSLFNGNIAGITINNAGLTRGAAGTVNAAPLFNLYGYDQLNRLVSMQAYTGLNTIGNANAWPATPTATTDYAEQAAYDPNGNIVKYNRNGTTAITPPAGFAGGTAMDQLSYRYYYYDGNNNKLAYDPTVGVPAGGKPTNQLASVQDAVADNQYAEDIDNQTQPDNYKYDDIGNLVVDQAEGLYNPTVANPTGDAIEWTVYGKIAKITKIKGAVTTTISYTYDVAGNRISKRVVTNGVPATDITTVYARDASGNVVSLYEAGNAAHNNGDLTQTEAHLYGSSRLGVYNLNVNVKNPLTSTDGIITFERTNKVFELSNHLGNVLATVSDRKLQVSDLYNTAVVAYNTADVVSAGDYYPFGMTMPGRTYFSGSSSYRYKFNGKEQDKETSGTTTYDYGFRIYNPALSRFLSVDPLTKEYPWNSTYAFAENDVIRCIDLEGAEKHVQTFCFGTGKDGTAVSKIVSNDYVQAKGTSNFGTLMGLGTPTTDEEDAARYIVQYHNLPTDGTFSFFEFSADLNKQKYARYDYTDANGKAQSQYFSAEIVDKTFEGYRTSHERNGKILNIFASLANLVGSGALLKAELKGISAELKAEAKASTGQSALNTKCFVAGTKILTKGGFKNIEDIMVGDSVWAYNELTLRSEIAVVKETLTSKANKLVKLELDSVSIWTTPEHPFFIQNKWVASNQISAGDSLTLFGNKKKVVSYCVAKDTSTLVYNFTVSSLHNYYVSIFGVLVHNDCSFSWQKNKAMNDILSKSIHGDVFNSKGVKVGEVGFELENGIITPKALGRDLSKDMKAFIEKVGNKQLETDGFKTELLNKVNEALNSGQIPASNRLEKLQAMQKMLTPPPAN